MGRVYLGRSPGGRTVALKMVRTSMAGAPGFRERFAREVRASQAVSGTGTVPVVAAEPAAPVPWLASAYVPGPALSDAVHEHGPLPEPALWRLLSGLAVALRTVHGSGLVHRDLKPSNVLLSLDGPLLIDFGIVRAVDETALTGTGLVVGSPGYMSPEQAEGRAVGASSDVFSLGAVLAYAATGRGPFGVGSGAEMLYRVVHRDPDLTGLPGDFASVVSDCLAKDGDRRPTPDELHSRAEAAVARSGSGTDWLPAPIASAIARKAEQLLNLEAASSGEAAPLTAPVTQLDPGNRLPLPPGSGAGLHYAPTTAPTTPPPMPQLQPPAPAPYRPAFSYAPAPYRPSPYAPADPWRKPPIHLRPDPKRLNWLAPWVQNHPLGKPLLGLIALIPMTLLLLISSDLADTQRKYHRASMGNGMRSLSEWAVGDNWHAPLTVLLLLSLIGLQVYRGRLQRYPVQVIRIWIAASAVYWMLLSVTAVLAVLWAVGMAWSTDAPSDANQTAVTAALICYVLGFACVLSPFTLIGGLVRLGRSMTAIVAQPASRER